MGKEEGLVVVVGGGPNKDAVEDIDTGQ